MSFMQELSDIADETGAGVVTADGWIRSIGLSDDEFRLAMQTLAEGLYEGTYGELVPIVMATFQAGVEWGRRYAPENKKAAA